jgi:hypothetical protein
LHRYAHFLLFSAHDVDASVGAAREAVKVADFEVGRAFLVDVLAIKGGMLHAAGERQAAARFFAEATQIEPDLESICPDLARLPAMLPGVFGIHAEGLVKDFSGSIGGRTLVYASAYATADEIEELLAWGANPNYLDAEEGAPLHSAILANNVAAVKVLLAHGANPLTPFLDGRIPSQLADDPSDAKRAEIQTLVVNAAGRRTSATGPVGSPLRVGYRYVVKKPISGDRWGYNFAVGEQFTFVSSCQYSDPAIACFVVRRVGNPDQSQDLALAKDQLSSWQSWFEELGPSQPSSGAR